MAYTLQVIQRDEELLALEPEWNALLRRAPSADVFLTHEWTRAWWKHFGDGADLFVITLLAGDRLVGLAPLMRRKERSHGLPVRQIRFLINSSSVRSDLILPEDPEGTLQALFDYLAASPIAWDRLELHGLSERAPATRLVPRIAAAAGLAIDEHSRWPVAYLPIDGDWTSYLQARSRHFRKHIRQEMHRLTRGGDVEFVSVSEPGAVEEAMERLLEIEKRSWKSVEGDAVGGDPAARSFFKEVVEVFSPSGRCRILFVLKAGQPIAGVLSLVDAGVHYAVKTFYDREWVRLGPGKVLFQVLIERAHGTGIREIDFDWKTEFSAHWTDRERIAERVVLWSRSGYARCLRLLKRGLVEPARALGWWR